MSYRDDIAALVNEFLQRAAGRMKKDVKRVSAEAMTALIDYQWPGNVRELEHAIERAVILAHGPTVTVRELPPEVSQRRKHGASGDPPNIRATHPHSEDGWPDVVAPMRAAGRARVPGYARPRAAAPAG